MKGIPRFITFLLSVVILVSCKDKDIRSHGHNEQEASTLLAIYDRDGYDEAYIANPKGEEIAHYVFVHRDDSIPEGIDEDAVVIRVPIRSAIIDSEVYASIFEELGKTGNITGMLDTEYVTSPTLKKLILENRIKDLGIPGNPNIEKMMELSPDALFLSYFEGMHVENIEKSGVPIIKMFDLQEQNPLGRAEWIKLIGLLLGEDERAKEIFSEVKREYHDHMIKEGTKDVRPSVLVELPYEGNWYVPAGDSYQARLIKDAGGDYFMAGLDGTGSVSMSLEEVIDKGSDADIWIIKSYGEIPSLQELEKEDSRYKEFKAFKEGNVYVSNTLESAYFREFPFHPERLLKDYRVIFSSDTVTPLRYFKRLK